MKSHKLKSTCETKLKSLATKKGWSECIKCKNSVELAFGCYHIYCRYGLNVIADVDMSFSRVVIERYYGKMTLDFHTNKKILEEVAIIPSKRLRNKIAGFSTHLMKRI
ncbi:putative ribosomal protein S17e [Helianthus annuus]|uniref:Ribosomal protein S17e n=1 Tax=Helianthus annuus TaxID=4232 RepID=A0A251SEW9_HELAN|nr:putative ribosomal protein S17e [Helianthus annuus]KAJ0526815.1 putative ribosomal protein S17e [Helianthus annuus]KAJ0535354.1 putative ribosomal protein S17e [Helianthus annuus]KAJ0543211.1 putative ribosomal protein S17e [Helianthus annuus]KAJ0708263.1 putative ribosomal protein S17e [Helianthus annuus]